MSDETKRLLAFFLCGLILITWMSTTSRRPARLKAVAPTALTVSQPTRKEAKALSEPRSTAKLVPLTNSVLENNKLKLTFSNDGGRLDRLEIKEHQRSLKKDSDPVVIFFPNDLSLGTPAWEFDVAGQKIGADGRYTSRSTSNQVEFSLTNQNLTLERTFQLEKDDYLLHEQLRVTNHQREPLILIARASLSMALGSLQRQTFNADPKDILQVATLINEKLIHTDLSKVKAEKFSSSRVAWSGFMDRYFMAALLPKPGQLVEAAELTPYSGDPVTLVNEKNEVVASSRFKRYLESPSYELTDKILVSSPWRELAVYRAQDGAQRLRLAASEVELHGREIKFNPASEEKLRAAQVSVAGVSTALIFPTRSIQPGESAVYELDLFLGPKDLAVLSRLGHGLDQSIELGDWIGVIARPMLKFMKWSNGFLHNFGWAIILLTVLVRLLLYPLTHMQMRSMLRMQALKPHIDQLRERHKEDREELNRRMLELFRSQKVNPMGGCLPLLLQMPVFFALYRVLYNAIELRHAPFMFWLNDLSAKDPYFVTPILLGGAMFVQQKMTPTAGMDPTQETMMKFMPVMFSFFMLYLPSGLTLYILVSTLLGLLQQWLMNRLKNQSAATLKLAS